MTILNCKNITLYASEAASQIVDFKREKKTTSLPGVYGYTTITLTILVAFCWRWLVFIDRKHTLSQMSGVLTLLYRVQYDVGCVSGDVLGYVLRVVTA